MTLVKILAALIIAVALLGIAVAGTRALGKDDKRKSEDENND